MALATASRTGDDIHSFRPWTISSPFKQIFWLKRFKTPLTFRCHGASEFEFGEAKSHRRPTGPFDSAVGANDAMRGDEEIDRRQRHRRRNSPMCQRLADGSRDLGI